MSPRQTAALAIVSGAAKIAFPTLPPLTTISESPLPEIPELLNPEGPNGFRRIEYGLVFDYSGVT